MFDWAIGGLSSLFGLGAEAVGAVTGWAWDKVTQGIYTWLANGLALLIEWVWNMLDASATPRLTDDWFRNELAAQIATLALAVTVCMMLASACQAALAGRPEQIGDAVREGARSVVASAFTITVVDVMVRVVDEVSAAVWESGRQDLVIMIERLADVATSTGPLGNTFVGPLCLFVGFVGLIGLTISLLMRSALIYLVAAMAPLVWASAVLPAMRGSSRRLVHLLVALIFSKLAIVFTLVVAVKLLANAGDDPPSTQDLNDAAAAVGELMMGFACFLVAAISPFVLYRLMPTVEGAVAASGIAGGWARSALSTAQAGMIARGLGESAATRRVAGSAGAAVGGAGQGGGGPSGPGASTPSQRPTVQGLAVATGAASGSGTKRGAATGRTAGHTTGGGTRSEAPASATGGARQPAQPGSTPVLTDGRPPGGDRPGVRGRRPAPASTSSADESEES